MATLVQIIKAKGMKVTDVSRRLGISPALIYQWNKNGIFETNPHYNALKEIIPELESKGKGKHTGRNKPKKALNLDSLPEIDIPTISKDRPQPVYHDFPKVIIRKRRDENGIYRKNGAETTKT